MCVPSIEVFFSLTAGKCVQSDHSMGARIYITFVETCIYLFYVLQLYYEVRPVAGG